jgi:hypothetical protein
MNDFNPMEELRKAIDALSTTQVTSVWQEVDGDRIPTKVTLTPLIRDLRESITSNIGAPSGGGALASQRNVIDAEALHMYDALEGKILRSYRDATSAVPFVQPEQNLRQWFIAFTNQQRAGKVSEETMLETLNSWSGWVRKIEDKLWPATTIEITAPCPMPECGKRWTEQGGESVTAVIVEYRKPTDDRSNALSRSVARCRACGMVWRGDTRLRELRFLIDQVEEKTLTENDLGVA